MVYVVDGSETKQIGMMKLPIASTKAHHVAGVWQRLFEEDPLASGNFDRDTLVRWTQAPCGMYVDIRLPENSPGRSLQTATAAGYSPNLLALLADGRVADDKIAISPELLNIFMNQKSFAGVRKEENEQNEVILRNTHSTTVNHLCHKNWLDSAVRYFS